MYFLQELIKFILGMLRNRALKLTAVLLKSITCKAKKSNANKIVGKNIILYYERKQNMAPSSSANQEKKKKIHLWMCTMNYDLISQRKCPSGDPKLSLQQSSRAQTPGLRSAAWFPNTGLHHFKCHHLQRCRGLK